ncbi:mitochondrial carrier [Xylariomycetidae sp. FL2044]|nr:mitochondrial carrier [Xylariomycetidae sp. FL2044]
MAADQKQKQTPPAVEASSKNYKGFVAGVFSGIAKLTVGHPFDTIKVRLQTTDSTRFSGPLQCLVQTIRHEGVRGLYKGATPPLVGWMFMDSVMLGSLTVYRRLLAEHVFFVRDRVPPIPIPIHETGTPPPPPPPPPESEGPIAATSHAAAHLPSFGHGIAGVLAGLTVSFIAAPVEHVKARLQIQYAAARSGRLYAGPLDCLRKMYGAHGLRGVYRGLGATLLFRSFFFFWWGSYDVLTRLLRERTALSAPAINFWAGGVSAQIFWLTSYPSDVVKQRIMTDPLGGALGDGTPRFRSWTQAARAVYAEGGVKGYWRGFVPCFLRAFPANAMALVAFEGVMRALP